MHDSLYRGSAEYYPVGRLPYPPELADALPLEPSQRVLDVGCGPGALTLLIAPRVSAVVGIDAEEEMLAEAVRQAARAGVGNVEWRHLPAEELPAGLGRFDLVTFAQSFHWMDRPAVAALVREMLEPGGAVVIVGATQHRGDESDDPLPHPRPPHDEIAALVRSYVSPARQVGYVTPEDEVMHAAGFCESSRVEVDTVRVVTRTVDEMVAATFSLSVASPHLFGDELPRFERELRALLQAASDDALFSERTRTTGLFVYRR